LREVSHRVKNNLQVISSILNLQADTIDDPRLGILFQASQDRLHSMALVHDLLQQADDVARINLAPYAARLTDELARTLRHRPRAHHARDRAGGRLGRSGHRDPLRPPSCTSC
jgi:two-component sensor histidine kinase